jgi:hypothetical protein
MNQSTAAVWTHVARLRPHDAANLNRQPPHAPLLPAQP